MRLYNADCRFLQGGAKSETLYFHSYGVTNNKYARKAVVLLIFWDVHEQ